MTTRSAHAMRPFRFGAQVRSAADAAGWRALAQRLEDLGFSALFLPDHFHGAWSPFVPLAVAAEATTKLHVGTLVANNDMRHPLLLAREAATLDLLSEGRLELGLGAGWLPDDYQQTGIRMDVPRIRIERLGESLEILRQAWRGEPVAFSGDHYEVTDGACEPRPCTDGGPPIIIGGGGRKILGIAARHADIIGVAPQLTSGHIGPEAAASAVHERYVERIDWIREAAGGRFDQIELQVLANLEHVGPGADAFAESVGPAVGLTPDQVLAAPITLAGTVNEICEQLLKRREMYGISYVVVRDYDAFAPIVERLAGK